MVKDQWNIIISRIFNSFAGELRKRERVGEGGKMEGEGRGGGEIDYFRLNSSSQERN